MTNKFKTTSDYGMIPGEGGGTGLRMSGAYAMSGPGDTRDQSGYFTGTRLTS